MNRHIRTVLIAPMTTKGKAYPTRVPCRFQGKNGLVVLDRLRTVDKSRLHRKLGKIGPKARSAVLDVLREMFAP